jgi:signal peptidase I
LECPSCTFQNTPGTAACVRCAGRLDFTGVDITPPRAGRFGVSRWARVGASIARFRFRNALADLRTALMADDRTEMSRVALAISIIPGAGQWAVGQRVLGTLLFLVWGALMAIAIVYIGTDYSYMFGGAIIGWHCFAVNLIARPALMQRPIIERAGWGLVIWVCLLTLVYTPAFILLRRGVGWIGIEGIRYSETLQRGDVIVYAGRWFKPDQWERGDLVSYIMRSFWGPGFYIRDGRGIDRIIALPGDEVIYTGDTLLVNGVEPPPELRPLLTWPRQGGTHFTVPEGHVVIVPSTLAIEANVIVASRNGQTDTLRDLISIDEQEISGRVLWRMRPWTRFGPVTPGASPALDESATNSAIGAAP